MFYDNNHSSFFIQKQKFCHTIVVKSKFSEMFEQPG